MAAKHTKQKAINAVVDCAKKYQEELENKSLLFICEDKHHKIFPFEFVFAPESFLHLTGFKVARRDCSENPLQDSKDFISAADFYYRCLNHQLSPDDFEFASDGTTDMKLAVLPSIINKNLSAKMIGNYANTKPFLHTEKLAGGVRACMGFTQDLKTMEYVPNTILQEDIRNHVTSFVKVIAAYRKPRTATTYEELTYAAKGVDWSKVKYPAPFDCIPVPTNS